MSGLVDHFIQTSNTSLILLGTASMSSWNITPAAPVDDLRSRWIALDVDRIQNIITWVRLLLDSKQAGAFSAVVPAHADLCRSHRDTLMDLQVIMLTLKGAAFLQAPQTSTSSSCHGSSCPAKSWPTAPHQHPPLTSYSGTVLCNPASPTLDVLEIL